MSQNMFKIRNNEHVKTEDYIETYFYEAYTLHFGIEDYFYEYDNV
jgi:hypothetical protein